MFNLYIFASIILLITLFSVCYLWYYIYKYNTTLDLYKYKIVSFAKTICIIVFYICIFVFFLYYLRINHFGKFIDLKELYHTFTFYYLSYIKPLPILHKSYIFCLGLLAILLFLLSFRFIIIKAKLEIFKLYIYILCKKPRSRHLYMRAFKINDFFRKFGYLDFLSYYIFKYIIKFLEILPEKELIKKVTNNLSYFSYKNTLSNYIYTIFIKSTPLFFVVYDCIYNDFIIIHVYYYLLIYIPLMLFSTITRAMRDTNYGFADILWHIYYNNNNNIKYVANKDELALINSFLQVKVSYIIDLCLDMVEFHLLYAITYNLQDNDIYLNNNLIYLKIDSHKIFIVTEDDDGNNIFTETKDYILL